MLCFACITKQMGGGYRRSSCPLKGIALWWGCAKGAEKASCRETVVQNAKMDSNSFSINSKVCKCFKSKSNLKGSEKKTDSPKTPFWRTVSPHDAFSAPLARSELLQNYRDSNRSRIVIQTGGVDKGILLHKHHDRNGGVYSDTFEKYRGQGLMWLLNYRKSGANPILGNFLWGIAAISRYRAIARH